MKQFKLLILENFTQQEIVEKFNNFLSQQDQNEFNSQLLHGFTNSPTMKNKALKVLQSTVNDCLKNELNLVLFSSLEKFQSLEALLTLRQLIENDLLFLTWPAQKINGHTLEEYIAKEVNRRNKISIGMQNTLHSKKVFGGEIGNPYFEEIRNTDTTAANAKRASTASQKAEKLIKEIELLPNDTKRSYQSIADELNRKGVKIDGYKVITKMTISRAYKRLKENKSLN
ncbi:hypothetical protein [Neptuniibacter sp. QD37_11]|uniref:hypothetical protein n=1 Tax=Neptuniibacter sp. QD37_11 TaxID=3398209 RepID=UPI0039F5EA76